jgi:hypothetical protein
VCELVSHEQRRTPFGFTQGEQSCDATLESW